MNSANLLTILNTIFAADQDFLASHQTPLSQMECKWYTLLVCKPLTRRRKTLAQTVLLPDSHPDLNTGPYQTRQEYIEAES